ncbi:MAG: site-2 protease family protein [Melioribacteraceae bacterium]|nr:site-2 protease family protein [Melioribacteraceae bacterium]
MPEIEINEKLIQFVIFLPLFLLSLSVHEFAHAYFANKFGDNTAASMGRLSLNPLKHIDLVGSVLMPLMAFFSGFALIGWAKPVPVNPNNFRNPYKDDAIVSAAGPVSNFVLAILFFIVFILFSKIFTDQYLMIQKVLWLGVYFNIFLFLFNLLPIPPLDGSHILFDLFPNRYTAKLISFGAYGTLILLFFIYSPLWNIFMNAVLFILDIFLLIKG